MPEPTGVAQGAAGEPQAAASSAFDPAAELAAMDAERQQQSAGEPAHGDDAAHMEWLKKLDVEKLPADVRQRLELPMLRNHTTTLTNVRTEYDNRLAALEARNNTLLAQLQRLVPQQAADDGQRELLEKAQAGDVEAIVKLTQQQARREWEPKITEMTKAEKIRAAESLEPSLREPAMQQAIGGLISQYPALDQAISANGYAAADILLAGMARALRHDQLAAEVSRLKGEIEGVRKAAFRQGVEAVRSRNANLETTTSSAGSAPSSPAKPQFQSLKQIMVDTANELGGWPGRS